MSEFTIGKFTVVSTLGTGAHSTILHVRRQADGKQYALKVVPIGGPEDMKYLEQAEHEFEISQKLDHPNLIKIYALELQKDWLFRVKKVHLLIEYVNGKTLDAIPVALDQLVPVFAQVAAGLAHMHRRGVFHADLKPNNILYGKRGEVNGVLLDDGTTLHLPPPEAERMRDWLRQGQTVSARGDILNTALGKVVDVRAIGTSPEQMTELRSPRPPGPKDGPDRRGPPPPPPGFGPPPPPRG